jgi:mannosyltransferase
MVGRTEPHKDHARGVEIVASARRLTGRDFHLTIVGPPGRAEGTLRELMGLHDPTGRWITRPGAVSDDELQGHYNRAAVLLHTSRAEGFGLPVAEAAARGLAVIHVGAGALQELFPGAGHPGASTLALADALHKVTQPEAWQHAVDQTRRQASGLSWETFEHSFNQIIDDLLEAKPEMGARP